MERSTIFNGKIHYFNGHFPLQLLVHRYECSFQCITEDSNPFLNDILVTILGNLQSTPWICPSKFRWILKNMEVLMSAATIDILAMSWKLEVLNVWRKMGGPMEMDRNGMKWLSGVCDGYQNKDFLRQPRGWSATILRFDFGLTLPFVALSFLTMMFVPCHGGTLALRDHFEQRNWILARK